MGHAQRLLVPVTRAPKPIDAATLVLFKKDASGLRILMGRRASAHSFMPDKYVFPGGKVDRSDRHVQTRRELTRQDDFALRAHNTRRHPRAFALAAIRETWEETGLIVGQMCHTDREPYPVSWANYAATGAMPCLDHLTFFARAITPPMRSKRFDARFFLADANHALIDDRPPQESAEMADLQWFAYDHALALDLPNVTRFILGEVAARLRAPEQTHHPAFLRWSRSGHLMTRIL
jgi:8-oxo-dGTP pyrophosphatase MutT (NUDIX family)